MAKQTIGTGTYNDDGTGDTVRAAFTKSNSNFTELYNRPYVIGFFAGKTPESESEAAVKAVVGLIGFAIYFFSVWTVSGYVIQ